jgi:hypothetical protein
MKNMQTLQNHKCDTNGRYFKKFSGEVRCFTNMFEAENYYLLNALEIQSFGVTCSICEVARDRFEKRNRIS